MRQGDYFERLFTTRDFSGHAGEGIRTTGFWHRLRAHVALWRHRAETRRQLARFRPRDMSDIGITRVDILREISKPFWRL